MLSIVDCNRMLSFNGLRCNAIIIRPIVKVEGNNHWGTFDCHLLSTFMFMCLCLCGDCM